MPLPPRCSGRIASKEGQCLGGHTPTHTPPRTVPDLSSPRKVLQTLPFWKSFLSLGCGHSRRPGCGARVHPGKKPSPTLGRGLGQRAGAQKLPASRTAPVKEVRRCAGTLPRATRPANGSSRQREPCPDLMARPGCANAPAGVERQTLLFGKLTAARAARGVASPPGDQGLSSCKTVYHQWAGFVKNACGGT